MSKRESKKLIQEVTSDACNEAFASYNRCVSELEVVQGKMNNEITSVKEKYESKITKLQDEKDEHFEMMQAFAEGHPELFTNKKSIETTHGVYGFRTGTPKLSPMKGFKWPGIFELVKERFSKYIRTKEELDKEKLLADRNEIDLKAVKLEVVQDETFYVQPSLENVATA